MRGSVASATPCLGPPIWLPSGRRSRTGRSPCCAWWVRTAYSPAFTAAAGGRNDLAREEIDPNRVRVLNVGRSFLGLGALTASLATGGLDPEEATDWLDDAGVATGMWVVTESERLESAPAEAFIEAPDGIPEEPYALLRVRLAARVLGGFETIGEASEEALASVTAAGGVGLVANAPEGLETWKRAAPAPVEWRECELPTFLADALRRGARLRDRAAGLGVRGARGRRA